MKGKVSFEWLHLRVGAYTNYFVDFCTNFFESVLSQIRCHYNNFFALCFIL